MSKKTVQLKNLITYNAVLRAAVEYIKEGGKTQLTVRPGSVPPSGNAGKNKFVWKSAYYFYKNMK